MAARLKAHKTDTGGKVELLLVRPVGDCWLALARPAQRLRAGSQLTVDAGDWQLTVEEVLGNGRVRLGFGQTRKRGLSVAEVLDQAGEVPLPPYIRRGPGEEDRQRYQTVFARQSGAVAAPTAGLHFTEQLISDIRARGVAVVPILLHVGPGTFEPIRCDDPRNHRLEEEYYEIGEAAADELRQRRSAGGRIIAVGTTSVRALETAVDASGDVRSGSGWTDRYIFPPYEFGAVDGLVTNFHLPRSTLLLLAAAFAGRDLLLDAYRAAVDEGYRFYSYGDAMLIL